MAEEIKNPDLTNNDHEKSELPIAETINIEFEKFKLRINFFKWILGTFFITIITIIINWGFRDREQGISELQVYDRYASESVVFAENPKNRLLLAQFFANVTPSENLKKGWKAYLEVVKIDVDTFNFKIKQSQLLIDELAKDTLKSTTAKEKLYEAIKINNKLESINNLKLVDEKAPSLRLKKNSMENSNIDLAKNYELKGFEALLSKDIPNAIKNFNLSENSFYGYHMVYDIAYFLEKTNFNLSNTSKDWNAIYTKILKDYSWKMPKDIKKKLTDATK